MEAINDGQDLLITCTMPSIEVGTIGGGTSKFRFLLFSTASDELSSISPATSACYAFYAWSERSSSYSPRRERSPTSKNYLRCSRCRRALAHVGTGTRQSCPVSHGSQPICTRYSRNGAGDWPLLPHSRADKTWNSRTGREQTAQQSAPHDPDGQLSKAQWGHASASLASAYTLGTFFRQVVGFFGLYFCSFPFRSSVSSSISKVYSTHLRSLWLSASIFNCVRTLVQSLPFPHGTSSLLKLCEIALSDS